MNRFEITHDARTDSGVDYKLVLAVQQDASDPPKLSVGYYDFQFESWEEYEFFVRMCAAHQSPFGGVHDDTQATV